MRDRVGLGLVLWFVSYSHFWLCEKGSQTAQLSFAFCSICPPLWSAASAGQLIACLSAQFAPNMARDPSGPAFRCLSAQFAPIMACGPSGPAFHWLAAPHSVRPERASLSFARPERASLSYARYADLRRSPLRVKSAPRTAGRLIIVSRMVTHAVASMPKTAKCACAANKVNELFLMTERSERVERSFSGNTNTLEWPFSQAILPWSCHFLSRPKWRSLLIRVPFICLPVNCFLSIAIPNWAVNCSTCCRWRRFAH